MPDVYDAYRPLRNYLKKLDLVNSLGAIKWYINYFQLKDKPQQPSDMEIHPSFWKDGFTMLLPWQMAVLAREVIINSPVYGSRDDMRQWKHLAGSVNKLKEIDEYIAQNYINQGNIMHYFSKVMSHQQFVWQENRPNYQTMTRYYHIYQHPQIRPIFEKFFGLEVESFFIFSILTQGNYMKYLGLLYPPKIYLSKLKVTVEDYDKFMKHYSLPLDELRKRLVDASERKVDEHFFYYFDSLRRYPVILTEQDGKPSHVCPVPTYLYWRTTDGVYYELVNEKGFDQAIGESFKTYIGEVLNEQSYSRQLEILDADTHIKKSLPKPDWLFVDSSAVAFIECKAKRMTMGAKNELNYSPVTGGQLEKMAESVLQCYKAVADAQVRSYSKLSAVSGFYPIIVTLESWFMFGDIAEKLDKIVLSKAETEGVDIGLITKYPHLVLSSREFEDLVAVLRTKTLDEVLKPFFSDSKYDRWALSTYLNQEFKKESGGYHLFKTSILDTAIEQATGKKLDRPS
ncbi:MAG: hypothetical protein ABIR46_02755 [Candidatus Saccharimonadales bacterium]